jgi:hypothetical protein
MLRLNHSNDELDEFFGEIDEEFEILESVIKSALKIFDNYEESVLLSKMK